MFVIENKPQSIQSEEYRSLRTNIQYSSFDKEIKIILVTSSNLGEGKTTTAGNLALAMSYDNKKVIIIDCDLRKPAIHKRFKVSNTKGMSEVLIGKESLLGVINKYNDNLDILTTGKLPPNPSEMLGSNSMTTLLDRLREKYDYVIIDSPPISPITDAKILATKVDGTILVVRAEKTKRDTISQTIEELKGVNAKIIGNVLNGVENKNKGYYGAYYSQEETMDKKQEKRKLFSRG